MSNSNTRVLITGGAGYLGSVMAEHLLDSGYTVTVLDKLLYGQTPQLHLCANPLYDFVYGDARDACIVGAPACDRDPELATSVNLDAVKTLNRLRSVNQLVVYPTTNSGYGTSSGEVYCTEETPLEPISLYGSTKCAAESEFLNSQNTITLRLATVFGCSPRMRLDLLVNHFVYAAFTDGYLVIFEKDFKRNYVHIRDVADCFKHCIENSPAMIGRPYNVGLDEANLSKEELALAVKAHIPSFYIHFAPIGSDPDKRNYIVSNQRLREAGFAAQRTIDDGIRELLKGYRMLGRHPMKNV